MTVPWTHVVELAAHHDIEAFRSGRDTVDTWLHERARSSSLNVATYVCLDDTGQVVGFFALTSIVVDTGEFTSAVRRGPRGQATGVLLAQMGLHESHHGGGHGKALFFRAAREAAGANAICRIPFLVVDAADETLVGWYGGLGMRRLPNTHRLVARLDKIDPGPTQVPTTTS